MIVTPAASVKMASLRAIRILAKKVAAAHNARVQAKSVDAMVRAMREHSAAERAMIAAQIVHLDTLGSAALPLYGIDGTRR